jgi:hypothetical protein
MGLRGHPVVWRHGLLGSVLIGKAKSKYILLFENW